MTERKWRKPKAQQPGGYMQPWVLIEDDVVVGKVHPTADGLFTIEVDLEWWRTEWGTSEAAMRACERTLDEGREKMRRMSESIARTELNRKALPHLRRAEALVRKAINASRPAWNGFAKEAK